MCTSFETVSDYLCDALSAVARCLYTSFVDPTGLSSFIAYRLIALDNNPGVRPIGIGEAVCCLIAKAILSMIFKLLLAHYNCVLDSYWDVRPL